MPTTYLLLRNNKQTGPLELEALLQYGMQPNDLIWIEGQSAGWQHPSEINSLKTHLSLQKDAIASRTESNTGNLVKDRQEEPLKRASHIFVSLPANMESRSFEKVPADALEAKAEALYQRVQAFAAGKTIEDTDIAPARSLNNMKDDYGAWQAKQERKKKNGIAKRRFIMAVTVLILTTSVFGISKWMRKKPVLPEAATAGYTQSSMQDFSVAQTTLPSFEATADSINAPITELPQSKVAMPAIRPTRNVSKAGASIQKKDTGIANYSSPVQTDTVSNATPVSVPENKLVREPPKKVIPLSRLVAVSGTLQQDTNGNNGAAVQVTFENNSTETLKVVAVHITYLKKEAREVGKETVYFYSVAPGTAPVINSAGNRRATSARFTIGAITRFDGSLYLIH